MLHGMCFPNLSMHCVLCEEDIFFNQLPFDETVNSVLVIYGSTTSVSDSPMSDDVLYSIINQNDARLSMSDYIFE